jgi:hypothetical protein
MPILDMVVPRHGTSALRPYGRRSESVRDSGAVGAGARTDRRFWIG